MRSRKRFSTSLQIRPSSEVCRTMMRCTRGGGLPTRRCWRNSSWRVRRADGRKSTRVSRDSPATVLIAGKVAHTVFRVIESPTEGVGKAKDGLRSIYMHNID